MSRLLPCGMLMWVLLAPAPARADEAEDRAAAFVEKLGGTVIRDTTRPGKPVVTVTLSGNVTDAGPKELAAMKGLRKLYLIRTKVTAGGLKELRKALPACEIRD